MDIMEEIEGKRVSIHALLAECDSRRSTPASGLDCFNPRTPCGVRRLVIIPFLAHFTFQSTHSLRSATKRSRWADNKADVSIHALLAECDRKVMNCTILGTCFNPRTPCGVRLVMNAIWAGLTCFNPRTPCGVRQQLIRKRTGSSCFNPRTPCGVRHESGNERCGGL